MPDLFASINNALLDLQSADLQSYPTPLRRLGRLLGDTELEAYNSKLRQLVDLDAFIEASEATQGGMVGSARLLWPENDTEILALQLLLIEKFAHDPNYMASFGRQFFWSSSNKIIAGVQSVTSQLIFPFFREYQLYIANNANPKQELILPKSRKVFIVHGHDIAARETTARVLLSLNFEPIILNEQANRGRTIIEKIEANSDVGFAVVLLTPDDVGKSNSEETLSARARQNVLLELGFFIAHLGRPKVLALKKGELEIPSDFAGVVWEEMDNNGSWKFKLAKELKAAGHDVDLNKLNF